jgi:tRNA(Ile)-lysidine synthase
MAEPIIIQTVRAALLRHGLHGQSVCVGLSGGPDSIVLLDTLDRLRAELQLRLTAIHVNHQISSHAAAWEEFCSSVCRARGISLEVRRVTVVAGEFGMEASARALRYEAFAEMDCDVVALGHHLDDQAETLLLQLLRGAGPRGLAAMPELRRESSGKPDFLRPLLSLTRSEVVRHATARGLDWITDDSNADSVYDRNFLRNEVLPLLESRFPGYRTTLSRASSNFADAALLADDLAAMDAGEAGCDFVAVHQLKSLSEPRALNLLRYLFAQRRLSMPPRARLEEALRQCREARPDSEIRVDFSDHSLRCYRGKVSLVSEAQKPGQGWQAPWNGRAVLALPDGMGELRPRPATGGGIAVRHFLAQEAIVRGRTGGESMRPAANGPTRPLKHLFQESAVPPWERSRMPLVFFGERLAWVPGIGVAAEFRASMTEPGVDPEWRRG